MASLDTIKTDIIGKRYGRLTVISYSHKEKNKGYAGFKHYYNCLCDCGNMCLGERRNLGKQKNSCGCIHKEQLIKRNKTNCSLNGESVVYRKIYNVWTKMKIRCYNKDSKDYKHYGGRGITICDEWLNWDNFKNWALENGYSDNLTIDRIDNNGNYEPNNCRWATYKTQANNKRNNKMLTYNNKTQTLAQWCEELNLDYHRTKARLNTCNMTVEQAFELPKQQLRRKIN